MHHHTVTADKRPEWHHAAATTTARQTETARCSEQRERQHGEQRQPWHIEKWVATSDSKQGLIASSNVREEQIEVSFVYFRKGNDVVFGLKKPSRLTNSITGPQVWQSSPSSWRIYQSCPKIEFASKSTRPMGVVRT